MNGCSLTKDTLEDGRKDQLEVGKFKFPR
jgi:hypothetical protein